MSETKDKGELLIIANLAEQAERYDGKYGLYFVSPEYLLAFSRERGLYLSNRRSFWFLLANQKIVRALTSELRTAVS